MNTAYILLGSNEGNRQEHLLKALKLINTEAGAVWEQSEVYITMAWGNTEQPDFLNQVLCLHTSLAPQQLLATLLGIEKKLGRSRNGIKWMQRIIDIDILFYGALILQTPELIIPHPFIQDRRFALVPLAEIASEYIHPVFKKNIRALVNECRDPLEVKKFQI